MTEPTDPKNGEEERPYEPGIFRPVPGQDERASTPEDTNDTSNAPKHVDGIRSGKPVNLEKLRLRERILGKIEIVQQNAEEILKNGFGGASEEIKAEVEGLISELNNLKNDVANDQTTEKELRDIDTDISEIEKELQAIRLKILKIAEEEKHKALLAQNEVGKLKLLYQTQSNYRKIKSESHNDLARLYANNPNDEVVVLFNNLSWLEDFNKIEEFAKKDVSEVNEIEARLNELVDKLFDALVNLDNKEMIAKEREFQEKLTEGAKAHSKTFIQLREEVDTLTNLSDAQIATCQEKEAMVTKAEKAFDTSLSNDAYLLFSKELKEYQNLVESMKPSVSISSTPEPKGSMPPNQEDRSTRRTPWDIDIPNISKDGQVENSYRVKIDGKFIAVPWVLLGTLNRYNTAFNDAENKDRDFSQAIELKEAICNAIEIADFKLADDNARALGALLDSFEKKTETSTEPEPTTPSTTTQPTTKEVAPAGQEEPFADFFGIKKASPLRPTVSGPEPSPAVKKTILSKTITEELERLNVIEITLTQSLPHLSSDLEKTAFTKLLQKQKALEESIKENPTPDLISAFKRGNDFLAAELNKKKGYIEARFGDITQSIPTDINNDTKIVRSARLRGAADVIETLGERAIRLKNEQGSADIQETQKEQEQIKFFEKHADMFERDPELYKEIYAQNNTAHDALTRDVSTHILATTNIPQKNEEGKRKAFLKNLTGLSPREHLKELTEQELSLIQKKNTLIANNLHGLVVEKYNEELDAITAKLLEIQEEKKKYTSVLLKKSSRNETFQAPRLRQVYRPSQDNSIGDTTRGLGRNFEFNGNNEVVKIDRENLTQEQIEGKFANEVNQYDSQAVRPLQEKVSLVGSPYPNHSEGMTRLFDEKGGEQPHAFSNEDIETVREQIEEEQAAKTLQEEQESRERANEKLARVGKLFDSLVKKIKPTTTRQWFILGLTTLGLATGAGVAFGKEVKENIPEDKRLIDEYKKQSEWEKYIADKVPKNFLKDFSGDNKLNYKDLLVKYAPSFNINPNNPSNADKLSNLLCKDVYFVVGANAGISEKQQVESSIFIDNLNEIMIAAQASLGVIYKEGDVRNGILFSNMTISQYYDVVQKIVETADSEKAKFLALKK